MRLRLLSRILALSLCLGLSPAAWAQKVRLSTTEGDIVLQLEAGKAPKSSANFLQYVQDRFYDGTVFHRVIDGFMVQGGGFDAELRQKPARAPIALEAGNGLKNLRGTVAMARTSDPNSATAQFFINVVDNPNLDAPRPDGHGYAVFAKVVEGLDVVDRIRKVSVGNRGMHQNVPLQPVVLRQATVEK